MTRSQIRAGVIIYLDMFYAKKEKKKKRKEEKRLK
jgi:hypothetical protein